MSISKLLMTSLIFGVTGLVACHNKPLPLSSRREISETIEIDSTDVLSEKVLTAEQQAALTPDTVLTILKKGNEDFVSDALTIRNNSGRIREAALGQYPKAVILSCLDSRVPVEDVFHRGIGDLFVARVAGNIVNEDILGSLEYACKVSGAKVIVVLGHEHCGAIKSAIEDVKLGNITALLSKIRPVVISDTQFKGEKNTKNEAYVHHICLENVKLSIRNIREKSPILKEMETKGEIKIVGGIYKMETGKVDFL
ncbi:MAG: carbonic anhydrase family protein [Candidatus Pedobacter colombiensis]|uniref:Carbonic anhydrase family protein n=1 Tax=Candidatus Pedobacter colombiensis TaxID=3121371 RepID=A0AAJ5W3D9_9SPHI|nr:carbonic anhydrase family protein [Pedobacter sp.]WEK17768.1 MAG: carbonic anhydrase family protein [Pedobacter sp.]